MVETIAIGFAVFGVVTLAALAILFLASAVMVVIDALDNSGDDDPWKP